MSPSPTNDSFIRSFATRTIITQPFFRLRRELQKKSERSVRKPSGPNVELAPSKLLKIAFVVSWGVPAGGVLMFLGLHIPLEDAVRLVVIAQIGGTVMTRNMTTVTVPTYNHPASDGGRIIHNLMLPETTALLAMRRPRERKNAVRGITPRNTRLASGDLVDVPPRHQ